VLIVLSALFVAAVLAPVLVRWLGRSAFYVLALVPGAGFVWLLTRLRSVLHAEQLASLRGPNAPPHAGGSWIPGLDVNLTFRLDALSATLCLLVLGVGALVLAYCATYFKGEDRSIGPFAAQLTAFAGAMFGLVTSDDLIVLFVFWELTTILSYLLIGYSRTRMFARRSALQALLVTTAGGLAMLVGLIALAAAAGTSSLSAILASAPELVARGGVVDAALVLILVGAVSKSALVPLHFWLPGAMAAPTPVSAYLHAAAMVKAGVYLVARLAPGFADAGPWRPTLIALGLLTLLVGGWRALRQHDIKLILAYGTVSQLGLMVMVVGLGTAEAALAGLTLMLGHGLFKSALFLTVGVIDHNTGTRDLRKLSGLWRTHPVLFVAAVIAAASMAGLPPVLGFVAKESVLAATLSLPDAGVGVSAAVAGWVTTGVVLGSVLTLAYSARFVWGAFAGKPGVGTTPSHRLSWAFAAAPVLLAAASLVLGIAPGTLERVVAPYARTLPGGVHLEHLALWHGLTFPLLLTAVVVLLGAALFAWRDAVERAQDKLYPVLDAERAYHGTLTVVDWLAVRVTGAVQRGQLTYYLMVILLTALAVPTAAAILMSTPWPGWEQLLWADSPAQAVIGAAMVVGAIGAVRAGRRFMAILMVSVTGYGMAAIFALQGAPDLALTQVLVETIVLVAFVLALRVLPSRLPSSPGRGSKAVRLLVSVAFGVAMAAIAAISMASRTAEPISRRFAELAYGGGHGKNIVNVTLVDLRAWDTFGEITVLAAAATGVASLIFVVGRGDGLRRVTRSGAGMEPGLVDRAAHGGTHRRVARAFTEVTGDAPRGSWLVGGRTLAPESRSIIIEVIARLLFHTFLLLSVYLLLAGHNAPGGGFAGGLVAGLALTLRYLAGGRVELFASIRVGPGTLLGSGLGIAALSGILPLFFGGQVFQSAFVEFHVLGEHTFVTSTFFDIGVYLVVVGLVLDVLTSLGAELDRRWDAAPAAERERESEREALG